MSRRKRDSSQVSLFDEPVETEAGDSKVDFERINNTLGKMDFYLATHKSVCVSVSGGSDSDIIVHIIATYFRQYLDRVHFVFANTGVEYRATLSHLDYLRERYKIQIEEVRGTPIPIVVRRYGVPFLSKQVSEYLGRLIKHGFRYEDGSLSKLLNFYPRSKAALRWWTNDWGDKSRFNIDWNKGLKDFLIKEHPHILISAECCARSKKNPLKQFQKQNKCDLYVTGERKSEGGARAGRHSSCFEKSHKLDHYMPLWFWDDPTKAYYKQHEGIKNSDCYEVWGLRRTGCVGCPFGQSIFEELAIMKFYEPQCYKLCMNVFGESYRLRKKYDAFRLREKEGAE